MLLEFKNVTGTNKGFNLQNVSFSLEEGYIMGVVGKNGAGKTTMLNYILDPKMKYTGQILYKGKDIKDIGPGLNNFVGLVSDDDIFFTSMTVRQNVECLSIFYSDWNQELFEQTAKEMGVPLGRSVSNLSRGEKMKFQMAFAMGHNAKLFLLDEATSGMDPVFRREFFQMLHNMMVKGDASVIMTDHNMEEVRLHMDYVARMENGTLREYETTI